MSEIFLEQWKFLNQIITRYRNPIIVWPMTVECLKNRKKVFFLKNPNWLKFMAILIQTLAGSFELHLSFGIKVRIIEGLA